MGNIGISWLKVNMLHEGSVKEERMKYMTAKSSHIAVVDARLGTITHTDLVYEVHQS